ncbi:MAG: acyl carrier protein [Clostridia bacterium]|nr:acyl carrier protein [Clostridia bacterium]MBQ4296798.1 acyl carrier protein [Clostridia bacterium]
MTMFEKVKEILVNELQIDESKITPEATLANDLGVNSLELAELVLVVEEQLDVEINEDDLHKFITVGDVADYLEALKK